MRIVTWNSQGFKADLLSYYLKKGYDIICCQETSNIATGFVLTDTIEETDANNNIKIDEIVYIYERLTQKKQGKNGPQKPQPIPLRKSIRKLKTPRIEYPTRILHPLEYNYVAIFFPWTASDKGNMRCSLAIYCKKTLLSINPKTKKYECGIIKYDNSLKYRPMLWIKLKCGYYICTIHLASGVTYFAKKQLRYYKRVLITKNIRKYLIMGDFNIDKDEFDDLETTESIHYDKEYTSHDNGKIYDYLLMNPTRVRKPIVKVDPKCSVSDHRALTIDITI